MRLIEMGKHFTEGRERRGLGMIVKNEAGVTTLTYTNGDRIATITDRNKGSFTLTLHPYSGRYGYIAHCNRLRAIFYSLNSDWENRRYSSFQRYGGIKIWDDKLRLELALSKDTNFTVKWGAGEYLVALDYAALETACLAKEQPEVKPVVNNSAAENSSEAINNLMALVATI